MLKNSLAIFIIGLFSPNLGFAGPAVLIEDNNQPVEVKSDGWQKNERVLGQSKSIAEIYSGQEFSSAIEMRTRRRVGVGLVTLGQLGMGGALIELNFASTDSFLTGYGGGPRFSSLSFGWKHIFGGKAISPYTSLGYSRWYSSNNKKGPIEKTTPGILGSRFLSAEEKETGIFAKDFVTPSVGLQYNQLVGPSVGMSLFAEIVLLMEASDLSPVPTGSLGALYYF